MSLRPLGSLRLAAAALLLALVAVTLPLKASYPRHVHEAPTAGVYNEDHVLTSLEFLGGDGPLPDLPTCVPPCRRFVSPAPALLPPSSVSPAR